MVKEGGQTLASSVWMSGMPAGVSKDMSSPGLALVSGRISATGSALVLGAGAAVNGAGVRYYWVALRGEAGRSEVTVYAGTGLTAQIPLSLAPHGVLIIPAAARPSVFRTSTMTGDISLPIDAVTPEVGNRILGLTSSGFDLGTAPEVNALGEPYHALAWRNAPGAVETGGYVGDGVSGLLIPTGFRPAWSVVKTTGFDAVQLPGAMPSFGVTFTQAIAGNLIGCFEGQSSDGFVVTSNLRVNQSGKAYHWFSLGGVSYLADGGVALPDGGAGAGDAGADAGSGGTDAGGGSPDGGGGGADAGNADAGGADGGASGADAGAVAVDGGQEGDGGLSSERSARYAVGCGCAQEEGSGGLAALLLLGALVRRRPRVAPARP